MRHHVLVCGCCKYLLLLLKDGLDVKFFRLKFISYGWSIFNNDFFDERPVCVLPRNLRIIFAIPKSKKFALSFF